MKDEDKVFYTALVSDIAFIKTHIWNLLYLVGALYGFIYFLSRKDAIGIPLSLIIISIIFWGGGYIIDDSFNKLKVSRKCLMALYNILVSEIKDTHPNHPEIISCLGKHRNGNGKKPSVESIQIVYYFLSYFFVYFLVVLRMYSVGG